MRSNSWQMRSPALTTAKRFRVSFIKRTTGEIRTLECVAGATMRQEGPGRPPKYHTGVRNLFTVFHIGSTEDRTDMAGVRNIPLDGILKITIFEEHREVTLTPDFLGNNKETIAKAMFFAAANRALADLEGADAPENRDIAMKVRTKAESTNEYDMSFLKTL